MSPAPDRGMLSHLVRAMAYETLVVLVTALTIAAGAWAVLQGRAADLYLRWRGPAPVSGEVGLVTIGEEALYLWSPEEPGGETTPRLLLAELVGVLDQAGARVIVLDVLLDRPAPGDAELAAAAAAHGAVLGAERFTPAADGTAFAAGISPTLGDAVQGAPANLLVEEGQLLSGELLVRRLPLVRRVDRARLGGSWPTSLVGADQSENEATAGLALAAAWLYRARGRDPELSLADLRRTLAEGCGDGRAGRLRCTASAENLGLPATPRPLHAALDLNFRGPEGADGLPTVPAARLLRLAATRAIARQLGADLPLELPADVASALHDKLVVVGRTDRQAAAADRFVTPYAVPWPMQPDMSGVRIQAQAMDTLLSGRHLRLVGRPWTWLLGLGLAAGIVATRRRASDGVHALAWLGLLVALACLSSAVFAWTDGLAIELAPPLAAALLALLVVHVRGWARHDLA